MPSTKIAEALAKLTSELPPLADAKATAVAGLTEAQIQVEDAEQNVVDAQADLTVANAGLADASNAVAEADADYDAKIAEVIALLNAAQAE